MLFRSLDPSIAKSSSFFACTRLLHYTDVTYGSYISQMHVVFFGKIQAVIQCLFFFCWSDFLACSAPKVARSHFGYKSNFICGGGKARNLHVCYMSSSGEISYSNAFVLASVGLGREAVALCILGSCPSLSHIHTH